MDSIEREEAEVVIDGVALFMDALVHDNEILLAENERLNDKLNNLEEQSSGLGSGNAIMNTNTPPKDEEGGVSHDGTQSSRRVLLENEEVTNPLSSRAREAGVKRPKSEARSYVKEEQPRSKAQATVASKSSSRAKKEDEELKPGIQGKLEQDVSSASTSLDVVEKTEESKPQEFTPAGGARVDLTVEDEPTPDEQPRVVVENLPQQHFEMQVDDLPSPDFHESQFPHDDNDDTPPEDLLSAAGPDTPDSRSGQPIVIADEPEETIVKPEPVEMVLTIDQKDRPTEYRYVALVKSEDGSRDLFDMSGFGLGPPIELGPDFNRGFTRHAISGVLGGNVQTVYQNRKGTAPVGSIIRKETPYCAFNTAWNPDCPVQPGHHGMVLYEFNDEDGPGEMQSFARISPSNWRYTGLYNIRRWGNLSLEQVGRLPDTVISEWAQGAAVSGWGKTWITGFNKRLKADQEKVVVGDPASIIAGLLDGRLVIGFTIMQCIGYTAELFDRLVEEERKPSPRGSKPRKKGPSGSRVKKEEGVEAKIESQQEADQESGAPSNRKRKSGRNPKELRSSSPQASSKRGYLVDSDTDADMEAEPSEPEARASYKPRQKRKVVAKHRLLAISTDGAPSSGKRRRRVSDSESEETPPEPVPKPSRGRKTVTKPHLANTSKKHKPNTQNDSPAKRVKSVSDSESDEARDVQAVVLPDVPEDSSRRSGRLAGKPRLDYVRMAREVIVID